MTAGIVRAPDAAHIKAALRAFIAEATSISGIGDDADLYESGVANSLFAIQLMTFVEQRFGIDIDADDLDMDNFRSLDATAALVLRKQGHGAR